MAKHLVFEISGDDQKPQTLHVVFVCANQMSFDLSFAGKDYSEVIHDICRVAPSMMEVDHALAEMYDNAGRTKPNPIHVMRVNKFQEKYRDALSNVDVDFLEEEQL